METAVQREQPHPRADDLPESGNNDAVAFRQEARAWLAANFPPSLAGVDVVAINAVGPIDGDALVWKQRMGAKGWGAPTWPSEYGGGGLNAAQAQILHEEMAAIGARNPIGTMGINILGPTLLEFGNEAQKMRHIPAICRGTSRWCQGYSEPGAGSDLASLQTRAEDKGDHFLVNGQKVWTSGAQYADWCFCLVRTDPRNKHEGISFLLIDMKTPGVEVRLIKLISGDSPFCETFLTDVLVPKENLVGPLNGGWTIAKRLLQHERSGHHFVGLANGTVGRTGEVTPLDVLAKSYIGVDADGRIADADLRSRFVRHQMEVRAFMLTMARNQAEAKRNGGPSNAASIMKNVGAKIGQDRAELALEIMGLSGLGRAGDGFAADELAATRQWLNGKASTIYGGTTEIQNNVIAKRILGLLDHQ